MHIQKVPAVSWYQLCKSWLWRKKKASAKMDTESNCVNMISRLYTCASTHRPERTKQHLFCTFMQSCDKFAGIFEKQHERLSSCYHRLCSDISSLMWFHWQRETLGTPLRQWETVGLTRAYEISFVAFLAVTWPMAHGMPWTVTIHRDFLNQWKSVLIQGPRQVRSSSVVSYPRASAASKSTKNSPKFKAWN